MKLSKSYDFNTLISCLFLFQYSLLMGIMKIIPSMIVILVSSIFLMTILFFKNIKREMNNQKVVFFVFFMVFIEIVKVFWGSHISLLLYGIAIPIPALLCFLYKIDFSDFLDISYKLSYVNFIINILIPFTKAYDYMRYGYGMIVTPIFIMLHYLKYSKLSNRDLVVVIITIVAVFLYGGRGPFLTLVLFFAGYILIFYTGRYVAKLVAVFSSILIYINVASIIDLFYQLTVVIGIRSYAIAKYRLQLRKGLAAASSSRDGLYETAIEKFKEHIWFGNDISLAVQGDYVHNLFLQVAQDFGITGIFALLFFLIFAIKKITNKNLPLNYRLCLWSLFSISFGRLMVSSVYWKRPEFWMLISLCLVDSYYDASKKTSEVIGSECL